MFIDLNKFVYRVLLVSALLLYCPTFFLKADEINKDVLKQNMLKNSESRAKMKRFIEKQHVIEVLQNPIGKDQCKSVIKVLNEGVTKKKYVSEPEIIQSKKILCRCILQGESYPSGMLGLGDELQEIKYDTGIYGLGKTNYLKPFDGLINEGGDKLMYPDGSRYSGEVLNGFPNGKGQRVYPDGSVYEGYFAGGHFNGVGILKTKEGMISDGIWYNDELNGFGKFTYPDKYVYEGIFIDGNKQIKGKFTFHNGDIYEGDIANGNIEGIGIMKYQNGDVYEGEWLYNRKDGAGKLIYKIGHIYEGQFFFDALNGNGKLIAVNGDNYEAEFYNNEINGKCKITFKNGDFFDGDYDGKSGTGKGGIRYVNGESYNGEIKSMNRNGFGIFEAADGYTYEGKWIMNKKSGAVLKYLKQDRANRSQYFYENDQIQSNEIKIWKENVLVFDGDPNGIATVQIEIGEYRGAVKNSKPHGLGEVNLKNGSLLETDWNQGNITGDVKITAEDGTVLQGGFQNNKMNGKYIITFKNGNVFNGSMKDDQLDGPFVLTKADGSMVKGEYRNGELVQDKVNESDKAVNNDKSGERKKPSGKYDLSMFKPSESDVITDLKIASYANGVIEGPFHDCLGNGFNPEISRIIECMQKDRYSITQVPAEYVEIVATLIQFQMTEAKYTKNNTCKYILCRKVFNGQGYYLGDYSNYPDCRVNPAILGFHNDFHSEQCAFLHCKQQAGY